MFVKERNEDLPERFPRIEGCLGRKYCDCLYSEIKRRVDLNTLTRLERCAINVSFAEVTETKHRKLKVRFSYLV